MLTDGVPATTATVIPQIGSIASAGRRSLRRRAARARPTWRRAVRRGGPRRSSRGSRARSRGVRAPISIPAGTSISSSCSSGTPSARRSASTPRPACGSRRGRRRARPFRGRRRSVCSSSRPWAATTSARSPAAGSGCPPSTARARDRAPRRARGRAAAIGVSPTTRTRGAGSTGSRNISIAPPERHGLCAVDGAVLDRDLRPVPDLRRSAPSGTIRKSSVSSLCDRLQRVHAHAVLRADATDEPLDRAVTEHERDVARLHARRTLARTTVAVTNGVPAAASSCARRDGGRAHHCGGSGRPCIAAQTRAGVHGMSMWSTPCVCVQRVDHRVDDRRRRPDVRRLADALGAERVVRARRDRLAELEVGALERGRDQVVHERRVEAVALLVEGDHLHQRDADALGEAAVDLAVDDHRVDAHAAVVDRDEAAAPSPGRCRGRCRRPRCRRRTG